MKFDQLLAHLAVRLDEPMSSFFELFRALREGAERPTPEKYAALIKSGVSEEDLIWFCERVRYRGKPGPHGGLDVTPWTAGFFLTAVLCGGPRRGVAARALDMNFARYTELVIKSERDDPVCPITGARRFGDALTKILTDRDVFDQTILIRLSFDSGMAKIQFDPPDSDAPRQLESHFWVEGRLGFRSPLFHESILLADGIRWLFDALNEPEAAEPKMRVPA